MNLVAAWRINLFIFFFGSTHKHILIMWLENNAASSVSRKSSTAFGTTPPGDRITSSRWRNGSTSYWISSPLSKNCSNIIVRTSCFFGYCSCHFSPSGVVSVAEKAVPAAGWAVVKVSELFLTSMELVKLGTPDAEESASLKNGFGQIKSLFFLIGFKFARIT